MNARIKPLDPKTLDMPPRIIKILAKLETPVMIQEYLNSIPFNFEKNGETYMSPRRSIENKKAHCFEGALIASLALWLHGERPLLMDLKTTSDDVDHVVALFKRNGCWGAISKTNHAALRYRDPVYRTQRELVMSYFHEYFLNDGEKTLRSFSEPFDLSRHGHEWITEEKELYELVSEVDHSPHKDLLNKEQIASLTNADKIERKAGIMTEWKK
jgi:hypothetical protein